jgi:hypothetical protein
VRMEQQLPNGVAVLGVDEHTAVILDLEAGSVEVTGRGDLTVRRHGRFRELPAGTRTTLDELAALTRGRADRIAAAAPRAAPPAGAEPAPTGAPTTAPTLRELVAESERRFAAAGTSAGLADAVLGLETAVRDWASDTDEDDGVNQARAVLRSMIVRLAHTAEAGLTDPREAFGPVVDRLVALRDDLRRRHEYPIADAIRAALATVGVTVNDGDASTTWSWAPRDQRRVISAA